MLPERAFLKAGGQIKPQGGGSGTSSTPTQTTVSNTSIPSYAQPYVESTLGQASALTNINQNPYQPYQGQQTAGFSPLQMQAMQGISNQQVAPQLAEASNLASTAGQGGIAAYNTAGGLQDLSKQYGQQGTNIGVTGGGIYGGIGAGYGGQGAGYGANAASMAGMGYGAGANYANQATNPGAVGAYMSPYMQNVVNTQMQEANRNYDISGAKEQSSATQNNAFGGSREALMAAENERNRNTALNQIQATGTQNAYTAANQNMQYGAGLGLQGLQAGTAAQQAGIQGAQTGISGANTGLQGVNTQLAGTGQGLQGVQGAVSAGQYGLAGLGVTNQAAANLGALGQTQFGQEQAINQAQLQAGGQQQALQQQGLNTAYNQYQQQLQYPYQQLSFMQGLYQGLPMSQSASTMYQATPPASQQLMGMGLGAAGLSKAFA
jgi:hypothetical protein